MSTTIYTAPPGMVFVSNADYAELLKLRAKAAWESAWINNRLPPYGKWVLVKNGKNGRVHIARRVKRFEPRKGIGTVFERRDRVQLLDINLWTEFPQ